ncbi:MAG: hypothetical protein ACF8SC_03970 [Phycisphaerales bacterium JB037]
MTTRSIHAPRRLASVAAAAALIVGAGWATTTPALAQANASSVLPQRETAIRLMRPVTVSFENQRLEDIMNFIKELTQADIEPLYIDDRHDDGLDPDELISLSVENVTVLDLIEKVLDKAEGEFATSGNSWQFSKYGTFECGPKERLNRKRRVEIYSISDMLFEVPDYTEAPTFDLNSILQSGQGGGGQSPFQDQGENNFEPLNKEEKAEEIVMILTELIEPDQWQINGGDGGSIRYWQGNLIVNAPDYMHRQLAGYPWWPARGHRVSMVQGRRWVSLGWDASFSEIDGFGNQPVSAVVNGEIVRSGRGPGGGG